MAKGKITSRSVNAFKGKTGKDVYLWDTEVKGFGLRVQPSGRRSYIYKFRTPDGRRRNRKIGAPETLTAEAARKTVQAMVSDVALGKTIVEDRPKKKAITMRKLCDMYLEDYARLHKKPRSVALSKAQKEHLVSHSVIHAIRVLLMTGARLQEVLTMKWEYVDIENSKINLPDSKSGKKTIWLSDKARDYIDTIPHKRGNPYIFVGQRSGSPLVNLQKPWRKLRALAGIEDVRIHDLRHTYASLAVSQNLSLPIVGRLLGHKSAKSTERYAHLYDDVMKDAANF